MMDTALLRRKRALFFGLTGLAALLAVGTTVYIDIPYLACIALVPLFFLAHRGYTQKQMAVAGLLVGTIYGTATLFPLMSLEGWWFAAPEFFLDHKLFFWGSGLFAVAVLFFGGSFALFFLAYRTPRQYVLLFSFLYALLWGALEYAREAAAFGLSWGHVGYSLHHSPALLQLAAPVGVYGMSALVVFVNILLSLIVHARFSREGPVPDTVSYRMPAIGLVCIVLFVFGYGDRALEEGRVNANTGTARAVSVAHTRVGAEEGRGPTGFTTYRTLLTEAASGDPAIVVMPESVFYPIEIDRTTELPVGYTNPDLPIKERYDALLRIFAEHPETSFALGLNTRDGEKRYSSIVVYKNGLLTHMYDKRKPLVFAEKNESLHDNRLTRPIAAGAAEQHVAIDGVRANGYICSEIIYPHVGHGQYPLAISVSNEDSFSSPAVAAYNHRMARFRAVERDQYVLRATKDGYSAIITPTGEAIAESRSTESEILRGTIYLP